MKRVALGLVGCGAIGKVHLKYAVEFPLINVLAVPPLAAIIRCDDNSAVTFERGEFVAAQSESTWQIIGTKGSLRLQMSEIENNTLTHDDTTSEGGIVSKIIWWGNENIHDIGGGPIDDLAVPCIRVFGRSFPKAVSQGEAIDLLVEALSQVAKHAAERGVTVCLETHDAWCNPKHVAEVLKRVDRSAIGVNWDIMHPVRMGFATIEESFETLKPWIRHLHVHDTRRGGQPLVPIGTGDIDHKRTMELLQTISFDGYLSGEWINWEPHEIHLPRELATLKGYEQELH